jgi:plasmid stabilization system protein ParE
MRPVRLHPAAQSELDAAIAWYESERPGLGAELLEEFLRTLAHIRERPQSSAKIGEHVRRGLLHRFPYGVIFEIVDDQIHVVAVASHHRTPGYWRRRR